MSMGLIKFVVGKLNVFIRPGNQQRLTIKGIKTLFIPTVQLVLNFCLPAAVQL